jgi:hypothetical protein
MGRLKFGTTARITAIITVHHGKVSSFELSEEAAEVFAASLLWALTGVPAKPILPSTCA